MRAPTIRASFDAFPGEMVLDFFAGGGGTSTGGDGGYRSAAAQAGSTGLTGGGGGGGGVGVIHVVSGQMLGGGVSPAPS